MSASPSHATSAPKGHSEASQTSPLSKSERGRLKKLLKRARSWNDALGNLNVQSGIVTEAEWRELQQLHQREHNNKKDESSAFQSTFECSVQVHWRRKAEDKTPPGVKPFKRNACSIGAASHAVILQRFLATITSLNSVSTNEKDLSSQKRKRHGTGEATIAAAAAETTSSKAGWACLHNPAAVSNVVVLDLLTESSEAGTELESIIIEVAQRRSRSVIAVPTHWFERNQLPRSVSDALLYESPPDKGSEPKSSRLGLSGVLAQSLDEVYTTLVPLKLSRERMEKEGYPIADPTTVSDSSDHALQTLKQSRREDTLDCPFQPTDISLEAACDFVRNFQTTEVVNGVDAAPLDSRLAEFDLLPFVVSSFKDESRGSTTTERQRILALDCEMVKTRQGLELARITLCQLDDVTYAENDKAAKLSTSVLFDSLVRPRNTVIDYLTQYSGVTADLLNATTTTTEDDPETTTPSAVVRLEQVQAALLINIHPDDILIGHSLENDLHACRFVHATVIDTALLFQRRVNVEGSSASNHGTFKHSLRHLATFLLKKQIQAPDRPHCSEEDAVTALELAVQRALQGPSFDMASHPQSQPTNWMIQRSKNLTTVTIGPSDWLHRHVLSSTGNAIHALQCDSLHENNANALTSWLTGPKRRADLVCAQFNLSKSQTGAVDEWKRFETLLDDLLSKLSSRAVVLVAIQSGLTAANDLAQTRRMRRNPRATLPWSDTDETQYKIVLESCRSGSVLWIGGSSTSA